MPELKVGTCVTWSYMAKGNKFTRTGRIIAVVPPGKLPDDVLDFLEIRQDRWNYRFYVCPDRDYCIDPLARSASNVVMRKKVSYIIGVKRDTRTVLYWPRTSHIRAGHP